MSCARCLYHSPQQNSPSVVAARPCAANILIAWSCLTAVHELVRCLFKLADAKRTSHFSSLRLCNACFVSRFRPVSIVWMLPTQTHTKELQQVLDVVVSHQALELKCQLVVKLLYALVAPRAEHFRPILRRLAGLVCKLSAFPHSDA